MRRLLALTASALLAMPAAAQAHGLVGRRDLPVPSWLFAWAAAAVLLVSFVGLGALWHKARLYKAPEHRVFRVPAWFEIPLGALGVALLGLTIVSGLFGVQIDTANFAPTTFFVALWVGVPFASLIVGDLYAAINPLRALGRATGWLGSKLSGGNVPDALVMSERVGRWPAAVMLFAYAWVELAFPGKTDPSQLAVVIIIFCLIQAVGMSLYGTDQWLQRADPFTAWFSWVATLAPLRWERGTLYLRWPTVGNAKRRAIAGDAAIVIVAIGTTTWDGLSGGDILGPPLANLSNDVAKLGIFGVTWSNAVVQTFGMLIVVGLVTALIFAGVRGMIPASARRAAATRPSPDAPADGSPSPAADLDGAAPAGIDGAAATATITRPSPAPADGETKPATRTGPPPVRRLVREFTPTLVPIGVAYTVGHYLSLLAFQGQAFLPLLSDPLGHELLPGQGGWLGTAQWTINYTWLTSNAIWYLQVAALLIGHVMSLVLSHDRALERFPRKRAARSQRAMLVVAVVFTCTGLWLLSAVG
ncbi:MAG: hypothetical protein AAGC46_04800 [Solirubrobacteraceae bacterium]|nr:hypothetical protein [Patulibacter sp.]